MSARERAQEYGYGVELPNGVTLDVPPLRRRSFRPLEGGRPKLTVSLAHRGTLAHGRELPETAGLAGWDPGAA